MSSVQLLRDFISDRLLAAAADIFSEVEKSIGRYEQVIDRQRKLLEITWKPEIHLRRVSLPANGFETEEVRTTEHRDVLDSLQQEQSEFPHVEEGLEEAHSSPEDREDPVKQETSTFTTISKYEESGVCETVTEENRGRLSSYNLPPPQKDDQHLWWNERTSENHLNCENSFPRSENFFNGSEEENSASLDTFGRSLNTELQMEMHRSVQMDKKSYVCNICGKRLKYPSHVKNHMRSHTGEKPYSCKLCGRSFSFSCNLRSHERCHTGEKPHFCGVCGMSFSRKWNLKYHMRVHMGRVPTGRTIAMPDGALS